MKDEIPREVTDSGSAVSPNVVSLRCPDCGRYGTFEPVRDIADYLRNTQGGTSHLSWRWGQRRCPFPDCHAHVFIVAKSGEVIASYPPERIDFDKEGIPERLTRTLEEAITCYAEKCYVASAIMVRRTLERNL